MEYRILDTLARSLGESLSMRALAKRIEALHGTGAYPNVHAALQTMESEGLIRLDPAGRSRTVRLDIRASRDSLAQRDLQRYQEFRHQQPRARPLLDELHRTLFLNETAGLLVDPERGFKLNRLSLIAIPPVPGRELLDQIQGLARRHGTPIDVAPLLEGLSHFIRSDEWTPAPEWIRSGIAFHHPQYVWENLADVEAWPQPSDAPSLDDVIGSLPRHGYRELGEPAPTRSVCIEEAATQLIATGKPRRLAAAAIILAKNEPDPGLVYYLAKRRDIQGETMTILETARSSQRPNYNTLTATLELFRATGTTPGKLDASHIRSTLAKYA